MGTITFEDGLFGHLGSQSGTTRVTSLDFENGIYTDQVIDVEANEKQKRDALEHTRCVRSRINESGPEEMQPAPESNPTPLSACPTPANYRYPSPVKISDVPELEMTTESTSKLHGAQTSKRSPAAPYGNQISIGMGVDSNGHNGGSGQEGHGCAYSIEDV